MIMILQKTEVSTINKQEIIAFKDNVDSWIKDFNTKIEGIRDIPLALEETTDNTTHNYELINEVRGSIDDLKKQIQTMKMTQLLMIKKVFREDLINASKNKKFMEKLMKNPEFQKGVA